MIISASRRTDIPNYYSEWFFNRLKEGYVYVRNPMNIHQISKIPLDKSVVDGIVFWTKNPQPMLERIEELDGYVYYFQFTLNAYSSDIEPNVPSKKDVVIPTFQKLSKKIGKEKVIDFLKLLNDEKIPTTVRQVIIPTLNDDEKSIKKLKEVVAKFSNVDKIELLPFRKICKVKYDNLKIDFPFKDIKVPTKEKMLEKLDLV